MKIHARYTPFVFVFLVAFPLSAILSFANVLRNIGFADHWLTIWLSAWGFSFLVAYPVALVLVAFARKIIGKIVKQSDN